jgi:hypothetical protein
MRRAIAPNHYVQQHTSTALFLLTKIGVTITRGFSVIPLSVNFPAITPAAPSCKRAWSNGVSVDPALIVYILVVYWRAAHHCSRGGGLEELSTWLASRLLVLGSGLLRLCLT